MRKTLKYGLLIFVMIILIGIALKGIISNEQFDSEKWKNWTKSEAEWLLRWDMMNNLRNNHELKGKTETEIIKLLGKPDFRTENFNGYFLDTPDLNNSEKHMMIKFDSLRKVIYLKVFDLNK